MFKRVMWLAVVVTLAGGVLLLKRSRSEAKAARRHEVVMVISSGDSEDWHSGMLLADHFLDGVKPEPAEVEVLAYGGGIDVLKKGSSEAAYIAKLEAVGIHFVACQNAMKAHNLTSADLLPGVSEVPSGVVELVRKQEAGWAYVKVGK